MGVKITASRSRPHQKETNSVRTTLQGGVYARLQPMGRTCEGGVCELPRQCPQGKQWGFALVLCAAHVCFWPHGVQSSNALYIASSGVWVEEEEEEKMVGGWMGGWTLGAGGHCADITCAQEISLHYSRVSQTEGLAQRGRDPPRRQDKPQRSQGETRGVTYSHALPLSCPLDVLGAFHGRIAGD